MSASFTILEHTADIGFSGKELSATRRRSFIKVVRPEALEAQHRVAMIWFDRVLGQYVVSRPQQTAE